MKFTRVAAGLALPLLAVATAVPRGDTKTVTVTAPASGSTGISQCNTGELQCCNSVQSSSSDGLVSVLLGLLGVVLGGVNVPIGVTCSPITVIGSGSAGCTAAPVCCENNNFNGLIAIGCTPISINL
ncbi:hypothetical protein ACEPAH_9497 [Sanghuangporus vaninii]